MGVFKFKIEFLVTFVIVTVMSYEIRKITGPMALGESPFWNEKQGALYFSDVHGMSINKYMLESGVHTKTNYANSIFIFDLLENEVNGLPDGITIDTDGNLWIAVFRASCVIKVDPRSGALLKKIAMPVKQPTSVAFGGPNYDILFVTTARKNEMELTSQCGCTFMITGLGVKGFAIDQFKI